jgi:hypothetical protein
LPDDTGTFFFDVRDESVHARVKIISVVIRQVRQISPIRESLIGFCF